MGDVFWLHDWVLQINMAFATRESTATYLRIQEPTLMIIVICFPIIVVNAHEEWYGEVLRDFGNAYLLCDT